MDIISIATEKAIEKTAETATEKVTGSFIEKILSVTKDQADKIAVEFGIAFDHYLDISRRDLNIVKTIVDRTRSRTLVGKEGIFVCPQIKWQGVKYDITGYKDFYTIGKNIVICGTGGLGKTMLMKYLFVEASDNGDLVPIYIRLRKYDSYIDSTDLLDYINDIVGTYNVVMAKKQLDYCLKTGRLLLLFDGLDEVRHNKRKVCEERIQELQKKYPDNIYIVSSRHGGLSDAELRSFSFVELCPLDETRACELILKLTYSSAKGIRFVQALKNKWYIQRKDFASNPLLLTIMFMTYDENNRISNQLMDFYEKAFNALYSKHDAYKEGVYQREFLAKDLGMNDFKKLFSYLCFHSYKRGQYEFTYDEIIKYINKGFKKLEIKNKNITAEDFLADIQEIVCLIVLEDAYRFTHRSFQSYFAACYVSQEVSDENQIKLFQEQLSQRSMSDEYDFYRMLWSLQGKDRFKKNIIFPALESEFNGISIDELKNWDKRQIVKYYIENIIIQKPQISSCIQFQRSNNNHKESLLILICLLNNVDYFTAIGLTQIFSDDEEWLFPIDDLPRINEEFSIDYILGEHENIHENDTDINVKKFFLEKIGKDKTIDFFISSFKLSFIHECIIKLLTEKLKLTETTNKEQDWSDNL